MTHTILVHGKEFAAYDWGPTKPESPKSKQGGAGEVSFRCDQTLVVDTTFEIKGDGRSYVIVASGRGLHVAKPY